MIRYADWLAVIRGSQSYHFCAVQVALIAQSMLAVTLVMIRRDLIGWGPPRAVPGSLMIDRLQMYRL